MDTNDDMTKWSDMFQSIEVEGLKEMRRYRVVDIRGLRCGGRAVRSGRHPYDE